MHFWLVGYYIKKMKRVVYTCIVEKGENINKTFLFFSFMSDQKDKSKNN